VFPFSKRHYFKTILKIEKGAKPALQSISQQGFISFCPNCFKIGIAYDPFLEKVCKCGSKVQWAGPLWLGRLWDKAALKTMSEENQKREYNRKTEINNLLNIITAESEIPVPFYYDIHKMADKMKSQIPPFDSITSRLEAKGYKFSKTHFNQHAIKTDATAEDVISAIKQE
jgi:tRNA (guanine26-N2/guanine27-N2)-dimethyltransferase